MVKLLLITLLILTCGITSADFDKVMPNCWSLDTNGNQIGSKSTSAISAVSKLSKEAYGTYTVICPIEITVYPREAVATGEVTLSWTAPTQNTDNSPLTDLTNYKIYYGLTTNNMTEAIVDTGTSKKITGLSPNTYYFAVSAVNSLGIESEMSNVVSKVVM